MSGEYASVTVDAGTPECGLWCEVCQLPSGIRVPLSVTDDSGVQSIGEAFLCDQGDDGVVSHDAGQVA